MKQLKIGVRVRYIGGQAKYNNAALYLLIGRTGVITARSTMPGMDWSVEMDEGCYDLDAAANTLEPTDDDQADNWTTDELEHEAAQHTENEEGGEHSPGIPLTVRLFYFRRWANRGQVPSSAYRYCLFLFVASDLDADNKRHNGRKYLYVSRLFRCADDQPKACENERSPPYQPFIEGCQRIGIGFCA